MQKTEKGEDGGEGEGTSLEREAGTRLLGSQATARSWGFILGVMGRQ